MKKYNQLKYLSFEKIDHPSELAILFNRAFDQLNTVRILSRPITFDTHRKFVKNPERFYHTCLFEMYAHAVISKLEDWKNIIREYMDEYNGSWEFYARSKRIESIHKYGGEEQDYNGDGSIKTDVGTNNLIFDTVVHDLVQDDCRDIVFDTTVGDLDYILRCIQVNGSFNVSDIFSQMGHHIKSYRFKNGEMIENTKDDETLNKIIAQHKSEELATILYSVVMLITHIIDEIKSLPKDNDNKEFLSALNTRIDNILDMNISDELNQLLKLISKNKSK